MRYDVRVKEHLDLSWRAWLEGFQIVQEPQGTSLLSGPIRDQAALYGLLLKLRQLGLTLLSLQVNELHEHNKEEEREAW
jgi:hypothetical protein